MVTTACFSNLERPQCDVRPHYNSLCTPTHATYPVLNTVSVMDAEHGVAARSEPVKGALVPAGRGTKIASVLVQRNLTFRQRRP